jgi:hypothetical protein
MTVKQAPPMAASSVTITSFWVALSVGASRTEAGVSTNPVATAPQELERTLLLYCPEQGGWQTGEWCEGRWVSTADIEIVLEPTHWADVPERPTL